MCGRPLFFSSRAKWEETYAYVIFTPESDGFITITKDNAGTANLKTYVFHLVDLIDGNN